MAFKPRLKSDGKPCCFRATADGGMAFPRFKPCPPCTDYFNEIGRRQEQRAAELRTSQEHNMTNDLSKYDPPNGYEPELAAERAKRATPMSKFEERFAAERAAEIAKEHAAFAEFRAASQPAPRTSDADLAKYEPPNPYRDALAKEAR